MITEAKMMGGADARAFSVSGFRLSSYWKKFYTLRASSAGLYATLEDPQYKPMCHLGAHLVVWCPPASSFGFDVKDSRGYLIQAVGVDEMYEFYLAWDTPSVNPWSQTLIGPTNYAWLSRPRTKVI